MASSSNHVEENFDEILRGLRLGEYEVVWDYGAMRPTAASSASLAGLPNCCQSWTLTQARDGAEMAN